MPSFQGKRVSTEWKVVLEAAVDAGVSFRLNSGQRTFREQEALYRLYQSGQGNLAAEPSHNAPHIKTGRSDHALDVDMYVGDGVQGLAKWLRKQGASVAWNVPGEGWHIEIPRGDLVRLAKRLGTLPGYTASESRWIREHDRLKRRGVDLGRRRVLRRVMATQRKRLWRAAQGPGGWGVHHRRARYASLKARTT